jgi:hypothetical protein
VRGHAGKREPDAYALMVARLQLLGLLQRLEDPRRVRLTPPDRSPDRDAVPVHAKVTTLSG